VNWNYLIEDFIDHNHPLENIERSNTQHIDGIISDDDEEYTGSCGDEDKFDEDDETNDSKYSNEN